jgi:hypothetical protein
VIRPGWIGGTWQFQLFLSKKGEKLSYCWLIRCLDSRVYLKVCWVLLSDRSRVVFSYETGSSYHNASLISHDTQRLNCG